MGGRRAHRAQRQTQVAGSLERGRIPEDTLELIRRLAEHHPDRQIAGILNRQGRRTGTGLPFTEPRVSRRPRSKTASRPPHRPIPPTSC